MGMKFQWYLLLATGIKMLIDFKWMKDCQIPD